MRTITKLSQLKNLKQENQYPPELIEHLEETFYHIFEQLAETGETLKDFSLEEHGPIYLHDDGDDLGDLSSVGLNPSENGLLGSHPESVTRKHFGPEVWFEILLVLNNEYCIILLVNEANITDPKIAAWFQMACTDQKNLRTVKWFINQ